MAIIVQDSFNRADNQTTLGTADTGQVWQYIGNTVFGIKNNGANVISGTNPPTAYTDSGYANVRTKVKVLSSSYDDFFMCGFRINPTDGSLLLLHGNPIRVQSWSPTSGYTDLTNDASFNNKDDVFEVVLNDALIEVYQNGTKLFSFTSTFNQTATCHGLTNWRGVSNNSLWDDFQISSLTAGTHNNVPLSGSSSSAVTSTPATLKKKVRFIPSFVSAQTTVTGTIKRKSKITTTTFTSAQATLSGTIRKRSKITATSFTGASVSAVGKLSRRYKATGSSNSLTSTLADVSITHRDTVNHRTVQIAGTSSSTVNASASIKRANRLIPSYMAGVSTISGSSKVLRKVNGSASSLTTTSGSVKRISKLLPSFTSAQAQTAGTIKRKSKLTAQPAGDTATIIGSSKVLRKVIGQSSSSTTISGTVTITKHTTRIVDLTGSASSTVSTLSKVSIRKSIKGATTSTATAQQAGLKRTNRLLPGFVNAQVTGTAVIKRKSKLLPAFISAQVTTSGTTKVTKKLAGASASQSTSNNNVIRVRRGVKGATTSVASGTWLISVIKRGGVAGSSQSITSVSGSLVMKKRFVGSSISSVSVNPEPSIKRSVSGSLESKATTANILLRKKGSINGSMLSQVTATAKLNRLARIGSSEVSRATSKGKISKRFSLTVTPSISYVTASGTIILAIANIVTTTHLVGQWRQATGIEGVWRQITNLKGEVT